MAKYRITNEAESDLIRIHQFGIRQFGMIQADKYFNNLFDYFELIAQRPLAFKSVNEISKDCRCCPCGFDSIYYTYINDIVDIVAIVGSQDLDNIFNP
ncbi:MAG: type II toxin-antitoxin system RelE/ParE family toxin [Bacteroidetes bacterium]|nr:type II toxin-antitoxin system RelE/ParE family toxin [Bacteroidota bacterium]NOG57540.1 type II toxin-antitoxin system RelE/ParE family toxin [Bacteroidota bacterium]